MVTSNQYQIQGLEEGQPYWVRVSAMCGNGGGDVNGSASYSLGRSGFGVAQPTIPWFAVPAPQGPYKPTNVTFRLSTTAFVDVNISPGEVCF